ITAGRLVHETVRNTYTYLWEFEVSPELVADFEQHYGPAGTWAQLFRCSPDYIETLLLKDNAAPGRYLTVDRWRSEDAYLTFKSAFARQYAQLDNECEQLTVGERLLGGFSELSPDSSFSPNPPHDT
ncbi:MAG: antibiotic biosynthesis monooxygenase family protein, partial [Woeseiaceae bacterium]